MVVTPGQARRTWKFRIGKFLIVRIDIHARSDLTWMVGEIQCRWDSFGNAHRCGSLQMASEPISFSKPGKAAARLSAGIPPAHQGAAAIGENISAATEGRRPSINTAVIVAHRKLYFKIAPVVECPMQ
jgi:hypothetical protein